MKDGDAKFAMFKACIFSYGSPCNFSVLEGFVISGAKSSALLSEGGTRYKNRRFGKASSLAIYYTDILSILIDVEMSARTSIPLTPNFGHIGLF